MSLNVGGFAAQIPREGLPLTLVGLVRKPDTMLPVISLDALTDGSLVVIADIRDKDDKIIVRMDKNGFAINPNNYFSIKRPDKSTVIVLDQYGTEALRAHYSNPHSFRITGKFYSSGKLFDVSSAMTINNSTTTTSFSGLCMDLPIEIKNAKGFAVYAMPE